MNTFTNEPLSIKGPSEADQFNDGGNFAILDEQGLIIGEAIRLVAEGEERPAMENAVLWSIAPQLFDALTQCEQALTRLCALNRNVAVKRIGVGGPTVAAILGYTRGVLSKAEWRPVNQVLEGLQLVKDGNTNETV